MTFISYSQNFEDVLLWRALGHLPKGFYIDVGANDPVEHSVTKAFYDAGWSGINIEPLPRFQKAFVNQRPRDINLAIAAGATETDITLFDVPSVNGWASNDPDVAKNHQSEGFEIIELKVPQSTLNHICSQYVTGDIHFLKIDVEGFEGEVLRGLDLNKWRPWILIVEATMPNSRITNHETWEHLVVPYAYQFAYFDGLNRYYVANEHAELVEKLSVQANVFDDFISTHLDKAWANASNAIERANRAEAQSLEALAYFLEEHRNEKMSNELKLAEYQQQIAALTTQLTALYASSSWRITRPLRWFFRKLASSRDAKTHSNSSS